ncbi:MAG: sigma-70 family RNA polymerase sigma factor [bacterium]
MQTEKAAIQEVKEGNSDAYRLIVDRYQRGLCIYLANMLNDEMQAEDIAQEAFMRAYSKINTYNPNYAFSTWLYRIARNLALRDISKNNKNIAELDENFETKEISDSAHEEILRDEQKASVQKAISRLKPEYREVIILYYWNNYSYEEISQIINKPIGTVRTWLFRSKEMIGKDLNG